MELKIRPEILLQQKESYATAAVCAEELLDCREGDNPYGSPGAALEAWAARSAELYAYPHSAAFHEALIRFWTPECRLKQGMLKLCSGSMDGIYQVLGLFQRPGYVVLGIAPQFPDFVSAVRLGGGRYQSVPLTQAGLPLEALCETLCGETALLYIDNPNNPTGMRFPLESLRLLLERAARLGVAVLVDEAYGGYMEKKASAICLLEEFDNLLVLRSMSKAWGLASLRIGYIAASETISEHLEKIGNPYTMPEPVRRVAAAALGDYCFVERCASSFSADKKSLRGALPPEITMASTFDPCPICLLTHRDEAVDLGARMLSAGIKTVSGSCFEGVQSNSVRLRLPHKKKVPLLLERIARLSYSNT